MTRLSQIIAVEKGVKSDAARRPREARSDAAHPARLSGIARTYQPRDDDGDKLPPESTRVQVKTEDVLSGVAASLTRLFDVTLTKDTANCYGPRRRDVSTGTMLLPQGAGHLPAVPGEAARGDAALSGAAAAARPGRGMGAGRRVRVLAQRAPRKTVRSKKVPRNHVLAEATKEHPAQVQVYMEDVPAGDWTTVKFSGAVPAARVRVLTDRIAELQRAVKYAREEANAAEITDQHAGEAIFGYLFAGSRVTASAS